MTWDEFCDLLSGLTENTPLVRVAQIRTERDPEAIDQFTAEQRAMRSEWQRKQALAKPQSETDDFITSIQSTFQKMFTEEVDGSDDERR